MDVTVTLPDYVYIEAAHGKEFKHSVTYDWKPSYCHKCQMSGHDCAAVVHRQVQAKKKDPPVKKVWFQNNQ